MKKLQKLIELKYKLYQETKQDRLEELNKKISDKEISTAFGYAAICNSVFGKKRILSRKRIILGKYSR